MKLVLRHRECDTTRLACLLLNAGYRLQSGDVTFPLPFRDRLRGVFSGRQQAVVTLTHLCRQSLRRSVAVSCRGRHFVDNLRQLPLPTLLRDFVSFAGEFALDSH